MKFKVIKQQLIYCSDDYIVTDSWNYITARFEFSEEWGGLSKTAIFKGTNGTYSVLLTDDACIVPHEVLAGGFSVSVYGSSGNMRITADSVYINAVKSGYEDNQTPPDPTPTVYEEILDKFSDIKQADSERAEQVKQNADGIDAIRADMADMNNTLNTKVDKVSGKGLSSNDYTDEEKVKVNNVPDNTLEEINTLSNVMHSLAGSLDNMKVDKVQGKGLSENDYTTAEKTKLSGIEENANNYVLPDDVVHDSGYVHTDNNYTTDEKNKLAGLNNYDDTNIKADIAKKADKLKSIPHTTVSGNPIAITDALAEELPLELRVYGDGIGDSNNGKYEIPIRLMGKNLFNETLLLDSSKITKTDNGYCVSTYPASFGINMNLTKNFKSFIKPNTAYTISRNAEYEPIVGKILGAIVIRTKDETTGATVDIQLVTSGVGKKSNTFSLSKFQIDNIIYVMMYGALSSKEVFFSNIQLEEGETATEYEPYHEPQTATAILDTPLSDSEYIDLVSKKRNGETDITVSGNIELFDGVNKITCQTAAAPSKLEVSYYQDINKVLEELKNAILSQGGNV